LIKSGKSLAKKASNLDISTKPFPLWSLKIPMTWTFLKLINLDQMMRIFCYNKMRSALILLNIDQIQDSSIILVQNSDTAQILPLNRAINLI
jgi:hypothetical protein